MVQSFRREPRRPRHIRRRLVPAAAALVVSGALCSTAAAAAPRAPEAAASSPTIAISGDSVVATGLPSIGQATINVTRPDAATGQPVVIGTYTGFANPFTPFTVNTTTPTPTNPSGDCWQAGALSQAVTPDLQPGDTVTLTQPGVLGTAGSSTSIAVQSSDLSSGTSGPIAGCSSLAPWAKNAITSAPSSVATGADLTVSGVAQPLATGVAVSASDGSSTTTPVTVTPASDGSWTATIPASQLAPLAATHLAVTPVMAVADESTGAQAHVAGVGVNVTKDAAASTTTTTTGSGGATSPTPTVKKKLARVTALRVPGRMSLLGARRHGIKVSFVVPSGTRVVAIQLLKGHKSVYRAVKRSHRAGTRQTVTIPAKLALRLRPATYKLAVRAGATRATLGPAVTRSVRITGH